MNTFQKKKNGNESLIQQRCSHTFCVSVKCQCGHYSYSWMLELLLAGYILKVPQTTVAQNVLRF